MALALGREESVGSGFCRDCFQRWKPRAEPDDSPHRCAACGSPRLLRHKELDALTIGHLDCDAFYAAVEKRDNPDLAGKPVIIGGGRRGVVATACYTARIHGVHSAMPMFKALKACPNAVVVKPNMAKYSEAGKQVRCLMEEVTPLVEPLSIDEAFLDMTGTERLHKQSAAETLARLVKRIEDEVGVTASIGLSHNKFLAKLASDLDKPRGFVVIGREETLDRLAPLKVTKIWGVGKAFARKLKRDGIERIGQIQSMDEALLFKKYGEMGGRLSRLSRGLDVRQVKTNRRAKTLSSETTFNQDHSDYEVLRARLWRQCERVSARAKKAGKVGQTITLKLKTADFRIRTRSITLDRPTQLADTLFLHSNKLLKKQADGTPYRLLGIGIKGLTDAGSVGLDLLDADENRASAAESAIDSVRAKFGDDAIRKGRGAMAGRKPN